MGRAPKELYRNHNLNQHPIDTAFLSSRGLTWVQNFMILLSSGCSAFINKWHISDHSIYWMLVEVVISIQFFWCPPHVGDVL